MAETGRLVLHAQELFNAAGYLSFLTPAERAKKIRRTFLHWKLKRSDLSLMHGLFRFLIKRLKSERP